MPQTSQQKIHDVFDLVARIGATIAWLLIALVTFVDVIGREIFSNPIPGGYEIIQVLMTVGVFFSLPIVALRRGHVRVDLLYQSFPPTLARIADLLAWVVSVAFFALLAWALFQFFLHAQGTGERTVFLNVSHWMVALVMTVFLAATTICCLITVRTPNGNNPKGGDTESSEF